MTCKKLIAAQRKEAHALVKKNHAEEESNIAALLSADAARVLNKKLNGGHRSVNPVLACQVICQYACQTRRRFDDVMLKRRSKASEFMMRSGQPLQEHAFWKSRAAVVAAALPLGDLPTDAFGIPATRPPAFAAMPDEVRMICRQFDTSKQTASEAFATQLIPTKQPNKEHGHVTTTVLVQRLQTVRLVFRQGRLIAALPPEPFVMPVTFLKDQKTVLFI